MLIESFLDITINHWLTITSIIFSIGLYGFLTKKDIIGMLISIEIMLNIIVLNFIIFNQTFYSDIIDGQIISIFILAITAIETVVAIAILILIFHNKQSTRVNNLSMNQR